MKLFPHQTDALKQTSGRNRVAYYLDMGLGKTYIGSEKAILLNKNILVVCQKSKVDDWVEHFNTYYGAFPYCAKVMNLTTKKDFEQYIYLMKNDDAPIYFVGVINYELAFRRPPLLELDDFTLMLDESSIIQNRKTKQCKFIMKLRAKNVILLSGTPVSGKYENLWSQAKLLGWDIEESTFLKHYINFKKIDTQVGIKKVVDKENPYKNQERLRSKLRTYGAVFMKTDEVFDLPIQNFVSIKVNPTKEYRKFLDNEIITIDTLNRCEFKEDSDFYGKDVTPRVDLVGNTRLTKLLYSRQLCGQYSKSKLDAFKDLLQSTNDRLIVFYNFDEELSQLIKICEELGKPTSQVNGHTKDLSAYENEEDSVTLVQYQSGSKGLNLQKSCKIVYFTPTLSVENWMQSQKRTHRIGQEKPCFYYKMVVKNSVEEQIYKALERGVDYTDDLFKEEI